MWISNNKRVPYCFYFVVRAGFEPAVVPNSLVFTQLRDSNPISPLLEGRFTVFPPDLTKVYSELRGVFVVQSQSVRCTKVNYSVCTQQLYVGL